MVWRRKNLETIANSKEILSHLEMYQPLIRKCIATYPIIVI